MWIFEILWLRLRSLFAPSRMDSDLEEEVRFHIEAEAAELAARGVPAGTARDEARRRFGHLTTIKEDCREARAVRVWDDLFQDCRYAARSLLGTPLLSGVAVLTLALGIGANTAVFSVVYAVVLRPLPYPEPDRLVWVTQFFPRFESRIVPGNDFLAWQGEQQSFAALGAWSAGSFAVDSGGAPEQLRGALVTRGYFDALALRPAAGRLFTGGEFAADGPPVVVIGEDLWRERFGASETAVGGSLRINGEVHTVVGVAPRSAEYIEPAALWAPLRLERAGPGQAMQLVRVLGRLKAGAEWGSAQAELQLLARRAQEDLFGGASDSLTEVTSLHERLVGNVQQSLFLLWAAAGLVLLLTCANMASLLLARLSRRTREVALKLSLGARRGRLVRQLLTESLLLAAAGALAGIVIGYRGSAWLLGLFPDGMPRAEAVSLDTATLLFTLLIAAVAAAVFGTLPALRGTKANLSDLLKSSARTATGAGAMVRPQNALVFCQFALATVIAFHAGLLARSFVNLRGVDPGFAAAHVLTARVDLQREPYRDAVPRHAFWVEVLERLKAGPGISRASLSDGLPLTPLDGNLAFFTVEGAPPWEPEQAQDHRTRVQTVTADFFAALEVPVTAGRALEDIDGESKSRVVVINQSLAQRAFPEGDAVGKRLKLGFPEGPDEWLSVVGVAANVKQGGLEEPDQPMIYRPYGPESNLTVAAVVVRSEHDPAALIPILRDAVRAVDSSQPIYDVATMRERLARTAAPHRERALLIGSFAILALTLAGAGVFGVLSYLVARQTSELGLRMALGARSGDLLRLVLRRGLSPAAAGAGLGMAAALFLGRYLESWLFGVGSTDFGAFLMTVFVLLAVSMLACYLPARRASRLDPVSALRIE